MKIKHWIVCLISLPIIYLISIAIWSMTITEELVHEYRNIQDIELSERQKKILLTVEDPTFYSHFGLDISKGQGLTTITSSLVPVVYYKAEMNGLHSILQSLYSSFYKCCKRIDIGRDVVAVILNAKVAKDEQLQLFLKTVYMGGFEGKQYFGFRSASEAYFSKPIDQLTDLEFIDLVAMPIAPNKYHPLKNPKYLKARSSKINKLISGACSPDGWFDLQYNQCEA